MRNLVYKTTEKMEDQVLEQQLSNIFQKELRDKIIQQGTVRSFAEGTTLIDYGKYVKEIPFVISGAIKIVREDDKGNELFLYYLEGGDTCALSLSCCMSQKKSEIKAITEKNTKVLMIPLKCMDEWMAYSSWREFIFMSYQLRFDELLQALDNVAFLKLEDRLYNYFLDIKQSTGDYTITKTHQEIANDMNTSRVVVTRLLKKLADEEKIEMHRNKIEVL